MSNSETSVFFHACREEPGQPYGAMWQYTNGKLEAKCHTSIVHATSGSFGGMRDTCPTQGQMSSG